jgi:hypothetical protein
VEWSGPVVDLNEEPLLVLVDGLVERMHAPVLVPDLRGLVTFALEPAEAQEVFLAPTIIFHALRDMVAEGLIMHTARGYQPTDRGIERAREARERNPDLAQRAADAINAYAA